MNPAALTLHDAGEKLRKHELSSQELTLAAFQRIGDTDDKIHAFITLCRDAAIEQAKQADERLKRGGNIPPLLGIPIALKDIFVTEGVLTTCGSKILGNFVSPYDGTAVKKLKERGAVIVGKANMDEFAMGSSTENSALAVTRNPWNLERVPGGSSGGSAAAVAADQCIAALGTDTGGSIRQPAACCGVVGLKPTYGCVSRYGVIAFASSMDQVGPLTKDVRDCALMLEAIAGHDPADSTSADRPVPRYSDALTGDVKGLRLGVPKEYFITGIAPEVEQAVHDAIRLLEKNGAVVEEISLPHTEYAVAVYYIVATAEASSNLARYDGMRFGHRAGGKDLLETYMLSREEGFGAEVKRRIMLGTYALSAGYYDAYYLKAQRVRALIKQDFDAAFQRCDAILTPTAPTTAFKIGEKTQDPLQMYLSDIYTISVNLAGLPALSLPCGFDGDGMPIGLQIIGKQFDEATILRLAYAYEQATEWHRRKPRIEV
ncbi:MAG: Asp-tRNA(Asn)/Glu-tRNA(Gln) amidotransferase subunit GatA [Deltaproteobacteria bacterium]|nr:Asp-tRNA(Asn)/Glu-tRNA(Gln) amidotransferase subunit GatA [Deltaproteobacteria bacterium]MDZ4341181.1 Asp-tRNA(Asn)/Glu-tRNA(Gln) amidotransferase subunit GatA [Candidatus Binatia bacterium]